MAGQLVMADQLVIAGQRFYFPITTTTIELVSIFKMYFVFSNKKNLFHFDLSHFYIQMLSRDLGYGRLARSRQMKAMDEIQKENDMKISRNAQLMFYNYFVDQIGKIYLIFQLLYFSFVSLQTQH
jgi:hypothetical protein